MPDNQQTFPEIDNIRFNPLPKRSEDGLVGYVSFRYEHIVVQDVRLFERLDKKGYRLVYPENKIKNREVVYPQNKEVGDYIEGEVIGTLIQQGKLKTLSN